jgi:type IV pilus assembly protein PilQ
MTTWRTLLLSLVLGLAASPEPGAAADEGPSKLGPLKVRVNSERTVVTVRSSRLPRYTAFRLDAPPRLVLDLADSQLPPPGEGPVSASLPGESLVRGMTWNRIQDDASRTSRLVLDLVRGAQHEIRAQGGQLVITFTPGAATAEAAPSPKAPSAAEGREAASQAKATPTAPAAARGTASAPAAARAQVTGVDFQDRADAARVVIAYRGTPQVVEEPLLSDEAGLILESAELLAGLARTLETSAFGGPVTSVSSYPDPTEPGRVRVRVRLGRATKPRLGRENGRLVWEFPKKAAAATATMHAPPRVAGFGTSPLPAQVEATAPPAAGPPPPAPPPAATPALPRGPRRYTGMRVDLDFKDIDIHNLLRVFSKVGGVNIVTTDDVKGTVTVTMHDVPWDQALDAILHAKGLGQVRDGNLIRVAPQAQIEKEIESELARNKQRVDLAPIATRLLPLSYAEASKVLPRVQDVLSARGHVSFDERTNTLIVSDIAGNLEVADELVRNLDTQTPQVQIEARIVEARVNFARELGIQWGGTFLASSANGNPTGLTFPSTVGVGGGAQDQNTNANGILNGQAANPNFVVNLPANVGSNSGGALGLTLGSIGGNFNVNLRLSALENTGNIRILSAPKVTTLDNVESSIEQGIAVPVTVVSALGPNTVYVDAKLSLTVKPHITNDGSIVMNVIVTNNQPDFSRVGTLGSPAILKNQAKTQLLVRDGDTAVIGGIYTRTTSVNYNKIPVLGDIPVIGWLFKRKRTSDDRSELLIFITPKVLTRTPTAGR